MVSRRYGSKILWNFPGGKVEPLELPVEAAAREIEEEVGLIISNLKLIWQDSLIIHGSTWFGYYYTAEVDMMPPMNREKGLLRTCKFKSIAELNRSPSIKETLVEVAALLEQKNSANWTLPTRLRQIPLPLWHIDI